MIGTPSQSMLFVRPSATVQREAYRVEGAPLWSSGFGQILEKQGFVAFDEADHQILEDTSRLAGYDLVIVSWMPERFWTPAMVRGLSGFAGALVLEGPVPPALWDLAGFDAVEEASLDQAVMSFPDPQILAELNVRYFPLRPASSMKLAEKRIETRQSRLNRWDYDFDPAQMELQDWARRIARLMRLTVVNRLMKAQLNATFEDCLFAAANLLLFLKKGGHLSEPERAALSTLIRSLRTTAGLTPLPIFFGRKRQEDKRHLLAVVGVLAEAVGLSLEGNGGNLETAALKSRKLSKAEQLGLAILEYEAGMLPSTVEGEGQIDFSEAGVSQTSRTVLDMAILSWAARLSGNADKANELLLEIVRVGLDPETGRLRSILDREDHAAATTHPLIGLAFMSALSDPAEAPPIGESFASRYGSMHLAQWARLGLHIQKVRTVRSGTTVLLGLHEDSASSGEGKYPYVGACQHGNVVTYSFPILSTVVSYHAVEPLSAPFTDCDASTAILLEPFFFLALERLATVARTPLLRVEPWPKGKHYCLTVRHDVDRLPTQEHLASLLQFEKSRGLGVTWFWIFNRLDADQIRQQERAGHEIALHAMKLDRKSDELKRLATALSLQPGIYGECQHGGGGGDYWLGHPNVETSHDNGLLYSEGNSCLYDFPHRWPWVDGEGGIHFLDIVCISHSVSVDRPRVSEFNPGWNSARVQCIAQNSGHLMVLNHPDAYLDRLMEIVDHGLPTDGRLDWNCRQVAEWWRATHFRENLGARFGRDGVDLRPRYVAQNVVFSCAGLKEEECLPAPFREIEGRTSSMGLRYRRFVVDLVAASERTDTRRARLADVSAG